MCTAPAADDEKKYLLRLVCGNGLAIDAYHAMPLRAFAFSEIRATVYGATAPSRGSGVLLERAIQCPLGPKTV